jgi:hypothetical protein
LFSSINGPKEFQNCSGILRWPLESCAGSHHRRDHRGSGGASIFLVPAEPYKGEIFLAATLKNLLVSLITGLSLTNLSHWWHGVAYGALYGLAFGLVVFLAKGAFKSKDAPYVVPSGVIIGAVTGLLLFKFALHS